MIITKPAEEIAVCDFCERRLPLTTCLVCKRDYCMHCEATIYACVVEAEICKACSTRGDVNEIVARYAHKIVPIIKERNSELYKLNKESKDGCTNQD